MEDDMDGMEGDEMEEGEDDMDHGGMDDDE